MENPEKKIVESQIRSIIKQLMTIREGDSQSSYRVGFYEILVPVSIDKQIDQLMIDYLESKLKVLETQLKEFK
jgi:hypothetical protein